MSDSRMMAAADTLKALRDEKVELQAKMKEVQADIDAVEAELISLMTDEESGRCNGSFEVQRKTFVADHL